jgi:hypothetical protein
MTKFSRSGKTGPSNFLFWIVRFQKFQSKTKEEANFEDSRCFEVRKGTKRHQGIEIEENQVRSRSHKNWTIRFAKLDYPVFHNG